MVSCIEYYSLQCYSLWWSFNVFYWRPVGDVGFDDRELMREASSIEESLFQTPAPIGDASTLAAVDDSKMDSALDQQEKMAANDGFGDDDDDVGDLGRCDCLAG